MQGKHHNKHGLLPRTWRKTGGLAAGAVVLVTAAATAQATIPPLGPEAAKPVSADLVVAKATPGRDAPSRGGRGAAAAETPSAGRPSAAPSRSAARRAAAARKAKPTAADAIKVARSQVGVEEDGSGETKFQDWYMGTSRAKETVARDGGSVQEYGDASWCDMFVSWVGDRIGFGDGVGRDAWTVAHARWFRDKGRWGGQPRPGSIVFYAWDGSGSVDDIDHVGMVIKKNGDGTIQTVEGNTDNAVRIKTRSTDSVVGYGYPEYR